MELMGSTEGVTVQASDDAKVRAAARSTCSTCGTANVDAGQPVMSSYVYAIGKIEPRFPRPSVEKEFAQTVGRAATVGLTDRQTLAKVLAERENRYLLRQLCWVMTIEGLDAYILLPRDQADYDLLVQTLRSGHSARDLDVVIGIRGQAAGPEVCNGLMVPIVAFDQIYWFDREALIKAIPRPEKMSSDKFTAAAGELLDRILRMTDNAGTKDEDRALNYLAMRYPAIYALAANAFAANSSLTAVDVKPSPLSGVRRILDVIFSYTDRSTDVVEKHFVRVDVTEEFPFLVTKLSPYYDR